MTNLWRHFSRELLLKSRGFTLLRKTSGISCQRGRVPWAVTSDQKGGPAEERAW